MSLIFNGMNSIIFIKKIVFLLLIFFVVKSYGQRKYTMEDFYSIKKESRITKVLLPLTNIAQQKVLDIQFSVEPDSFIVDNNDTYAIWRTNKFHKKSELIITTTVYLRQNDLNTVLEDSNIEIKQEELSKYLTLNKNYNKHIPFLQSTITQLTKEGRDPDVEDIFNYVTDFLETKNVIVKKRGLGKAIDQKKGGAYEYAELMIVLTPIH